MDIVTAVTGVWTALSTWIVDSMESILALFYTAGTSTTPGSLTILGVLVVVAVGIAIFMLLMNTIISFFQLR